MTNSAVPSHAWSQAMGTGPSNSSLPGSRTEIAEHRDTHPSAAAPVVVTPHEAEHLVESLEPFPVEGVGSSSFLRTYGYGLERLSVQAHASAAAGSGDEYVVEAILTYGKLGVLVRTLLAVEAWRTMVFLSSRTEDLGDFADTPAIGLEDGGAPSSSWEGASGRGLAPLLARNGNALRAAFTLHVETTIVGLINLVLYRREAASELDNDAAVALVDYCARRMTELSVPVSQNPMVRRQKEPVPSTELARHLRSRTPLAEIIDSQLDAEYRMCVAAATTARYLCEHIESLPLSAQTRILDTHDYLMLMVPLVEEPPWARRRSVPTGVNDSAIPSVAWEKFVDNKWEQIDPADLLQVTKCEAQPWLSIFHLTCSNACRERYCLNGFRKSQFLQLRKYLNDIVLDQLPVLAEVMRYMDQLALMEVPESSTGQGSALLLQQVDIMREEVIRGSDWDEVVRKQFEDIYSNITDAKDEDLKRISEVYFEEGVEDVVGEAGAQRMDPMSHPVKEVILRITTDDASIPISVFRLEAIGDDGGTAVPTEYGLFTRIKMNVVNENVKASTTPPTAKVDANISFKGPSQFSTKLMCDDIDLPAINVVSSVDGEEKVPESLPSREWRQLGSLQRRLVLQLGFKRLSQMAAVTKSGENRGEEKVACYRFDRAFLSKPADMCT